MGRRLLWSAVLALLLVLGGVVLAPPAQAHTRAQAASDYRSEITDAPGIDGVAWRTYAGGDLIEVTNRGGADLIVMGYEDEPYLRVGPAGVFENRNSPATYLNADRDGDVAVPPRADATTAADWVRVADGPTRAWHDHRVHWMAPSPPPVVLDTERADVHVTDWTVPFSHGGQDHVLRGELDWVRGPAWWSRLLIALVLTAPIVLGLRRGDTERALWRPAAVGVAAIGLLNTIHFADELLAWPAPTLDVLFGIFHTALFVGVGLIGAAIAWQGRHGPLLSLGIASGAVAFHQGLLQLPTLTSSQLPTMWPDDLLRMAVALSVAQAVWVTAVVVVALRRRRLTAAADHDLPAAADHAPPVAAASATCLVATESSRPVMTKELTR